MIPMKKKRIGQGKKSDIQLFMEAMVANQNDQCRLMKSMDAYIKELSSKSASQQDLIFRSLKDMRTKVYDDAASAMGDFKEDVQKMLNMLAKEIMDNKPDFLTGMGKVAYKAVFDSFTYQSQQSPTTTNLTPEQITEVYKAAVRSALEHLGASFMRKMFPL